MLFFNLYEQSSVIVTLFSAICLFFATFYASKVRYKKGLIYFLIGFVLLVTSSQLQQNTMYFYAYAVSVRTIVFVELLLVVLGTLCLIVSSGYILLKKALETMLLFLFISIGILLAVYAVFIADNANIVADIRQFLPIIGMACVFISYAVESKFWAHIGQLLALVAIGGFITLMIYPMFFDTLYSWYVPVMLVFLLSFSYILMQAETLKNEIRLMSKSQKKTAMNIKNIIKSSPFPIVLSRLGDDSLIMANINALKLFGLDEEQIYRYHFKDFFVDSDNRKLLTERLEHNREVHDFEILVKTATGNTPFWLLMSANVIEYNNDIVLYSAFQNITLRKRHESVLQSQADRDPLTSVYNRRYFENKVAEKIKNAHIKNSSFAILMIDADKFKDINDTYGHKIGDKILIELASVCERNLRQEDVVARYGGEEFVVFVDNVDKDTAITVANRLKKAICDVVVYSDDKIPVSVSASIGVAISGISDNVSVMIKMADDAMYLAKQNGRNRVEMYDREKIEQIVIDVNASEKQIHPAFSGEEIKEISLLDGIESSSLIED
ncbi:MAG: sensor domain-containing diguanylate cyclase [Alphaproteobacteria bacterium]|nr:sensor domain-containing diguanylate cyclase [Alphaproteobacteria bacterium]MBQ2810679.1 sensor domain-containing diguanylate cyclase [Alphaproteobacteria bacterium]